MCSRILILVLLVECGLTLDLNLKKDAYVRVKSWRQTIRGEAFENWFNVYDPSFLSAVWPRLRNGVHLMLTPSCWDDVRVFLKDLADGRAWAYDVVDASGRYSSGLFAGNRHWLGSKERCLQMDRSFTENVDNETLYVLRHNDYMHTVLRREKYYGPQPDDWRWMLQHDEVMLRLVEAEHWPPHRLAYSALQVRLNVTKFTMLKSCNLVVGVCLPRSCTNSDIDSLITFSMMLNDNFRSNRTIPRSTKVTSVRHITHHFDTSNDIGAIVLIPLTIFLFLLAASATIVDFDLLKCIPYSRRSKSFDLPTYNNNDTKLVDALRRKRGDVMSIDSILAEGTNMSLVRMKKLVKPDGAPMSLDVVNIDRVGGSCNRCGKYKRNCPNSKVQNHHCPRAKYSSFASLSTEDKRKTFFCNLFLCFSLSYSWHRVFNKTTANNDLSLIHGMKVLATFWIIFVHVAMIASYNSDSGGDFNEQENVYFILAFGTIAFDMLFFVSGLFSSHHFFYLKSRYSVKELVNFGGACGQLMQFVCFVTNRVIRLLPSYVYAILVSAVVARWSRDHSALALLDGDHVNCDQHWWRSLLYVSTAYPQSEQCLQVSWFLSTESQLHCASALACALGAAGRVRARVAAALVAALALGAAARDAGAAYVQHDVRFWRAYDVYATIIQRPFARAVPYCSGVFAGWLIHRMQGRLKLTKLTAWLLWVASCALWAGGGALASGPRWLAAGQHAAWAVAALWPVLLATTRHAATCRRFFGSSCVAALSRLSYGALLLHGAVARYLLLGDSALCAHTAAVWMYFCGTLAATLVCALLLALLVEMPCCSLLRRLSDTATS